MSKRASALANRIEEGAEVLGSFKDIFCNRAKKPV